jgi:membrane protein implicated in regulation of membrane protease activity
MDLILARAQIGLATFYALAVVGLAFLIVLRPLEFSESTMQLLQLILAQLVAVLIMSANYFFQRQRPQTEIDHRPEPDQ